MKVQSTAEKREKRTQPRQKRELGPATPWLELYQRESCASSHAVRDRLSQLGLDFIAHNVSGNDLKHMQLVKAGGKDQIPFLIDHRSGAKLYDSDSIIAYLENEYGEPEKNWLLKRVHQLERLAETRAEKWAWRVRQPLERARTTVNDGWETLMGTYRLLRNTFSRVAEESGAQQEHPEKDLNSENQRSAS